jgi:hypothetical protein|uniref:Uncharacterized protein n=1 Tax=Siphoviridae sp. ctFRY1 TaxID=2827820 RepID=A0A8S5STA5_9CAUD|nr:MAG TPA: hypothetical protein [Siphoviridae sp. ctFRY1]
MSRRRAKQLSWLIPLHCIRIWAKNATEGDSVFWSYRDDVKPLTQTKMLHQFMNEHGLPVKTSLQPIGIRITLRRKPIVEQVGKHRRLAK